MEFDKNRVYTALNADELKVGSTVIVANDLRSCGRKSKNSTILMNSILATYYLNPLCAVLKSQVNIYMSLPILFLRPKNQHNTICMTIELCVMLTH